MLIYLNDAERSRLLQPYVTACERGDGFLTILSGEPGKEKRKLSSSAKMLVQDARVFVKGGSDPVRSFIELSSESKGRLISGGFDEWLLIGDWTYLSYGSLDAVMKVERHIVGHLDSTVVCCYRNRGFSSLPLTDIGELFEMHDAVLLPSVAFVK